MHNKAATHLDRMASQPHACARAPATAAARQDACMRLSTNCPRAPQMTTTSVNMSQQTVNS
eukprot:14781972-Alexandrium_andersonii.AAC.1